MFQHTKIPLSKIKNQNFWKELGLLYEFLLNEGGHIGYSIRPTERKKGYATIMLKLALQRCRELNLDKVLITCDKVNLASAKAIHRNNGILENEIFSEAFSETIQRYWIKL